MHSVFTKALHLALHPILNYVLKLNYYFHVKFFMLQEITCLFVCCLNECLKPEQVYYLLSVYNELISYLKSNKLVV